MADTMKIRGLTFERDPKEHYVFPERDSADRWFAGPFATTTMRYGIDLFHHHRGGWRAVFAIDPEGGCQSQIMDSPESALDSLSRAALLLIRDSKAMTRDLRAVRNILDGKP